MKGNLYVFSSTRAMQEFLKAQDGGFLPQCMLIGEFFSQVLLVEGKSKIPPMMRKILLSEVFREFEFEERESEILFFEKNFLGYLETSSFLLTFFNELNHHKVSIKDIPQKDIYGDYEDHLRVLEKVQESYERKLGEYGVYDFPHNAKILDEFVEHFERIDVFLDGFLTPFEIEILREIATRLELAIHLNIDEYNISHYEYLSRDFEIDHTYVFSLSSKKILQKTPAPLLHKPNAYSCTLRLDQCAFILQKIQEWLDEGISEDEIAIILPKDDFKSYLKVSDEERNLNFAMGFEPDELLEQIRAIAQNQVEITGSKLEFLIENLKGLNIPESFEIQLDEIIYIYQKMSDVLEKLSLSEIVHLLCLEVEKMSIDDFRGGRVRVMGLLETRGLKLKRAIIPDFVSSNIPKVSQSDVFLNTKIRKALGMPTLKDRQDLQKHYYLEIFKNTEEVELLYFEGEFAPFGKEIEARAMGENRYTLFECAKKYDYVFDEADCVVDEGFALSATSLSRFCECKRAFYWKYLKKLEETQESEAINLGLLLHQLLFESYSNAPHQPKEYFEKKLLEKIQQEESQLRKLELRMFLIQMQKFFANYESVDEILSLERGYEIQRSGLRLYGRIDRIDRVGSEARVIDYKSGKNVGVDWIQSAIYACIAREYYAYLDTRVFFCSLREGKFIEDEKLQEHIQKLDEILEEIKAEREFAMTSSRSKCRECAYRILCNR